MDQADGEHPLIQTDAEMRELLGMFEVPAFARRGHDLEYAVKRLHERLRRERAAMLDMVRLRLKQWSGVATSPSDLNPLTSSIESYFSAVQADPPQWVSRPGSIRARKTIARDLVASIDRFNRRWRKYVTELHLETVNRLVDRYNRYYLLEKECSLGSSRLAARFFVPQDRLSMESLLGEYPLLAVPTVAD